MLQSVRVKNFALIEELEVEFGDGLNILTGETGAGKSILLGSIQTALGAKTSKDVIRSGESSAFVELVFEDDRLVVRDELLRQELTLEQDHSITISRKLTENGKSVCRINGEIVTASVVKAVGSLLLEIHGQQEHHTLLSCDKHLELVDRYAGETLDKQKAKTKECYQCYSGLLAEYEKASEDGSNKNRDISYMEFASKEIADAGYRFGEMEELKQEYEKLSHAKAIAEGVGAALAAISLGSGDTAEEQVSTAIRCLSKVSAYDGDAGRLLSQAEEIAALVSDFSHEAAAYLDSLSEFEEEYARVSERLTLLNRLLSKYGKTMEEVVAYGRELKEKLERYADFDTYLEQLKERLDAARTELEKECEKLSSLRKKAAKELSEKIITALSELNFLEVRFEIRFEKTGFHANGWDSAEFFIAANPGEEIRPLIKVASGGELSRIMLALKSVFADRDEIPTLIFDEIDTGISGRTAQMVSEKMAAIARNRQILCITHLPQIAAMADRHYHIEKTTDGVKTATGLVYLTEEAAAEELAHMLGGVNITDAVRENAKEMKQLAKTKKKKETLS